MGKAAERKSELEKEMAPFLSELRENTQISNEMAKRRKELEGKISMIKNQIDQIPVDPIELQVSDHAVLRFMQREHGIDIDGVRDHIISMVSELNTIRQVNSLGFKVRDKMIVTYIPVEPVKAIAQLEAVSGHAVAGLRTMT